MQRKTRLKSSLRSYTPLCPGHTCHITHTCTYTACMHTHVRHTYVHTHMQMYTAQIHHAWNASDMAKPCEDRYLGSNFSNSCSGSEW